MRVLQYNSFSCGEGVSKKRVLATAAAVALAASVQGGCSDIFEPDCRTYLDVDGAVHTIESEKLPGKQMYASAIPSATHNGITLTFEDKRAVLTDEKPSTRYSISPDVDISFTRVTTPNKPYVQAECVEPKAA